MADDQAPEVPHTPYPSANELLARFTDAEPNDPDRPGGTLSDLLDELGDAFVVYGQAFNASAAMLRRDQPRLGVEAADLDAAGSGLTQAGWACRQLAPNLRGFLPPLPWLPADAEIPPRPDHGGRREPGETEPDTQGEPSSYGAEDDDARTCADSHDEERGKPAEGSAT